MKKWDSLVEQLSELNRARGLRETIKVRWVIKWFFCPESGVGQVKIDN
ncbi:MAG: hypothetical protein KAQ98_10045 [Bacteriovoracaceae bacterium]|nr:hypothetical protein [Bacteriovoracaceae bacterium]